MSDGVSGETQGAVEIDPGWALLILARDPDHGWTPRVMRPENLPPDADAGVHAFAHSYWRGARGARWSDLQEVVASGDAVGVFPERSGLVVIDCDVRQVDAAGFVVRGPGLAQWSGGSVRRGTDDLARVANAAGAEVPRTWRVRTKSGGEHLYFRQRPAADARGPVASTGHRDGWLIDVKASANTWVVAPPTPGYTVVDDHEPVPIPEWLSAWLAALHERTLPVGGVARAERAARRVAAQSAYLGARAGLAEPVDGGLLAMFDAWCSDVLREVAESNRHGAWNNAIFVGACSLLESGVSPEVALRMVMRAAAPWDGRERRAVLRTVGSAYRTVFGHAAPDGFGEGAQ